MSSLAGGIGIGLFIPFLQGLSYTNEYPSKGNWLVDSLQLKLDQRGNIEANNYQTSQPWVFAAGDTVSGASLVVTAIDAGRKAADAVDLRLKQ